MIASQRYEKIIEQVNRAGIINIKEIAKKLGVTEATIRRDCELLEKEEKLVRVHGGAKRIAAPDIRSNFNDMDMKARSEHYKEKEAVCRMAASFVRDGECVYLDGGTTIVPILKYLMGKRLKIVTPSTLIAEHFEDDNSELILTGGKFAKGYDMTIGPLVSENLKKFNFNHAFIGCTGIEVEKELVYTGEIDTMNVKEIAMHQAIKKYLLIDSSKVYVKGFYGLIGLREFDVVFCNVDPSIDKESIPENFSFVEV